MGKDCKGRVGWKGRDGMGRMEDVKGEMGVEGRDGKYGIGREGWDELFGREG